MSPLKARFHGDTVWHLAAGAEGRRTLCGLPLEAGRTFSCTWKAIAPEEICRQCRASEEADESTATRRKEGA